MQSKKDYIDAIETHNYLEKRSGKSRRLTARYLVSIYGLDSSLALFRNLRFFWGRDPEGRPLICVYGDRDEMLRFLAKSDLAVKKIALVLGDEDQSLAFAGHLPNAGYDAFVSDPGMSVEVG